MRIFKAIRLSVSVPVLVFGAFSLLMLFFTIHQYQRFEMNIRERAVLSLKERLARTSARAESLLKNNLDSLVAKDITGLGLSSEVRSAFLIDKEGIVLNGSHAEWNGRPVKEVLPFFDRARFLTAQEKHEPDIQLSADRAGLIAYQPVEFPARSAPARRAQAGMIIVDYDLSRFQAEQRNALLMQGLVLWSVGLGLMLLLWLLLSRWLTRPLLHLKDIVHQYRSGDYAARARISGKGELAELAEAFNAMADEVLRNSAQLQAVLNAATEYAIIATDLSGIIRVFNPGAERMTGYTADEVIGKQTPLLWHLPSEISEKSEKFSRILGRPVRNFDVFSEFARQGKVLADEWTMVRKNGTLLATRITVTAILEEQGRVTGYLAVAEDVTEHRKSADLIANILESVDEGFIILDRNFRILSANRAYAKMVGLPLEQIIGSNCYELSHHVSVPCSRLGHSCSVQKTFETRTAQACIHIHQDPQGNPVYVETKAYPLAKAASGEILTAIETLVDVTEKKKLEDQLHQSQKMESIGTLAGGIAHDFNNILTAIIGYGHIVLMKMAKDDPQRLNVEHMLEAGDRAAHLTKDLLLFSRKQISERKPVDLNVIVNKVERFLKRVIGEDVDCWTTLSAEPMHILGDAHQLEQVLMNLATNARDAMSTGGTFTITTERIRLNKEVISLHGDSKPGNYVLTTIADTGKGMDASTREHIFEPFFTTKEVGKGTGLGLAVVYGIIKQHDGFIKVYSEPGEGTAFKIYLPLIASDPAKDTAQVEPLTAGGSEAILLAEDDATVRGLTTAVLEDAGYTVIAAIDGQDAVNKYKVHRAKIRLLLFDLIMPRKTGKEAYDEINAITPGVKVLFASGYPPDMVRQKVSIDEGTPVLFKPGSPRDILKQVRKALDAE